MALETTRFDILDHLKTPEERLYAHFRLCTLGLRSLPGTATK